MRPVRVASYNTRDFLDDRDAAASVVRAIDPDVNLVNAAGLPACPFRSDAYPGVTVLNR